MEQISAAYILYPNFMLLNLATNQQKYAICFSYTSLSLQEIVNLELTFAVTTDIYSKHIIYIMCQNPLYYVGPHSNLIMCQGISLSTLKGKRKEKEVKQSSKALSKFPIQYQY